MSQMVLIDFVFAICIGNVIFICNLYFYFVQCFAIKEIKIIYVIKFIFFCFMNSGFAFTVQKYTEISA